MKTTRHIVVELLLAAFGGALVVCAIAANQTWFDRHFLPSFVVGRTWYVRIETGARVLVAAIGVILAVISRRRLARILVDARGRVMQIALAVVLAILAAEAVLRGVSLRPAEWLLPGEEPRRQPDAMLGWTLVPDRDGHLSIGGRAIDYAVNRLGYRVRSVDDTVDPVQPTIVFIGESIVFGEGLTWDESIPAQTGAMLDVQTANLGVNGYGTDQAYLRLSRELPRFQHPTAVVSIFMPVLFGRNLDDDRPHVGPGLTWLPAVKRPKTVSLVRVFVPYRTEEQIERGIAITRDVLRSTAALARARGAAPLLIVPRIGAEDQVEAGLRRRVLDEGGVPYLTVPIDDRWTIDASDRHPDARGAHAIAAAIASACAASHSCR